MKPHRLAIFTPSHQLLKRKTEIILTGLGVGLVMIGLAGTQYLLQYFSTRFYPGTTIDGQVVEELSPNQVAIKLAHPLPAPEYVVTFQAGEAKVATSSTNLGLHKDSATAIQTAFEADQQQTLFVKVGRILGYLTVDHHQVSPWKYDELSLSQALQTLQTKVKSSAVLPSAQLQTTNNLASLKIDPGKPGKQLNINQAMAYANHQLDQINPGQQSLDLSQFLSDTTTQLTPEQVANAQKRAEKLVGKNLVFKGDDQVLTVSDQQLISFLALPEGYQTSAIQTVIGKWNQSINRPPQEPVFEYVATSLKVNKFIPPKNGLKLDADKTMEQFLDAFKAVENEVDPNQKTFEYPLTLAVAPPSKSLAETNDLGIKEQIGQGDSKYQHSIPTRIQNVALTSSRINNTLVKPGDEFSFNQTLGDVSAETGFKPAYIIKDGQTILGDGGGVCQVSTTLFRALLNAGLKITRRLPHSYRVSYYELNQEPGFDATVYSGNVDLRFINDTDHYVLITSEADSKNLTMRVSLYGTSDGRTTTITGYKKFGAQPAPPTIYMVDASLAPGQKKQIDFAASGIKTEFTNVIKDKDGQVIRQDVYKSNYTPWAAKYLVGP